MLKHTAPWFIQNELAQRLIIFNPAGLLPDTVTRRLGNAADNDVSNFTFSMARHDVYDLS